MGKLTFVDKGDYTKLIDKYLLEGVLEEADALKTPAAAAPEMKTNMVRSYSQATANYIFDNWNQISEMEKIARIQTVKKAISDCSKKAASKPDADKQAIETRITSLETALAYRFTYFGSTNANWQEAALGNASLTDVHNINANSINVSERNNLRTTQDRLNSHAYAATPLSRAKKDESAKEKAPEGAKNGITASEIKVPYAMYEGFTKDANDAVNGVVFAMATYDDSSTDKLARKSDIVEQLVSDAKDYVGSFKTANALETNLPALVKSMEADFLRLAGDDNMQRPSGFIIGRAFPDKNGFKVVAASMGDATLGLWHQKSGQYNHVRSSTGVVDFQNSQVSSLSVGEKPMLLQMNAGMYRNLVNGIGGSIFGRLVAQDNLRMLGQQGDSFRTVMTTLTTPPSWWGYQLADAIVPPVPHVKTNLKAGINKLWPESTLAKAGVAGGLVAGAVGYHMYYGIPMPSEMLETCLGYAKWATSPFSIVLNAGNKVFDHVKENTLVDLAGAAGVTVAGAAAYKFREPLKKLYPESTLAKVGVVTGATVTGLVGYHLAYGLEMPTALIDTCKSYAEWAYVGLSNKASNLFSHAKEHYIQDGLVATGVTVGGALAYKYREPLKLKAVVGGAYSLTGSALSAIPSIPRHAVNGVIALPGAALGCVSSFFKAADTRPKISVFGAATELPRSPAPVVEEQSDAATNQNGPTK